MGNLQAKESFGLTEEIWSVLAADQIIEVPVEIRDYPLSKLVALGNAIMMEKTLANPQHWYYKLGSDTNKKSWKIMLALPIEEQAKLADVPSKCAPWTVPDFLQSQLKEAQKTHVSQMNLCGLANFASCVLIAKSRNIDQEAWTKVYETIVKALKKHFDC